MEGKCTLITGAARRVGAAIAERLHDAGSDVAIHFRGSSAEADKLCANLNERRADSARAFQADLLEQSQIESLATDVTDWRGRVDVLVNNASSFYPTPLGTITDEDWRDLTGSNLRGPIFLSQALSDTLQAQHGSIVNIVDIHARRPLRDHTVYSAAKAGLIMLTRSLAKDLAPNVRVNSVAPGAIMWPEDGMTDAVKGKILEQVPLGRKGSPEDIAAAVLFLARDATYVTGQMLKVDGGRAIGW